MANCIYIIGQKVFNSEIELDDYLSETKSLYKLYGDEVFSRKETPIQQNYREKLFKQKKQLEDAFKSGRLSIDYSINDFVDVDGVIGKYPDIGVSSFIKELRTLEGNLIFPLFQSDNYWEEIKKEIKVGNFDGFFKDYVPYIFEQKPDGTYDTHPIETEEEFKQIRQKVENIWKQQGLIGTIIHDIFDMYYKKDFDPSEVRERLKQTEAYRLFKKDFKNDISDSLIENIIQNCEKFDENLRKQFPVNEKKDEKLLILPELTIRGAAIINNQGLRLTGRIDLLVITPEGEINIIDYKCSPKEYSKYNDAKKLTFDYQLAVYRRIIQQLGLNSEKGIRLWTVPIQFEDFFVDRSSNKVSISGIKLRESGNFEELPNSRATINEARYSTIENNLDNSFKSVYVEDISADSILTKTRDWIAKVFPQYARLNDLSDENIQKYLEKRKVFNEETGTWGYKRYKKGDLIYPDCKSEAELVSKVKKEWQDNRNRNYDRVRDIKRALKEAQERKLGRGAIFNIARGQKDTKTAKQADWAQQVLQKYANDNYEIVPTPPAYDSLGMIFIRNKITDRIDVIKMSHTYDLDASLSFGNERKTLFGNYMQDQAAQNIPDSLVMQATRGNIELMEAMYAINCIPSIFNNGNGYLGEVQIISPYNEGGGVNNKSLQWNFGKLMQFSKESGDNFSYGNDKKAIKVASFVQLASDTLQRIKVLKENDSWWSGIIESKNKLDQAFGNKDEMLGELMNLKKQLEEKYPYILKENINTSIYDDYNTPEIRLYAEVLLSIGELNDLKYTQQVKDHANYIEGSIMKAFLWDGFNGNLTDNPGTLRSETLNQASHLVDVAYQNIRDQLFKYKNEIEPNLDKLKSRNGKFNKEQLYQNLYDSTVTNDLVFKNPFTNPNLNEEEREILKQVLLKIVGRRKPSIQTLEDLELEIENNPNTLLVPLIPTTGKSLSSSLTNFWGGLRNFFIHLNPKNWNIKEKLEEAVSDEESEMSSDEIWEFTNSIDASMDPSIRQEMITKNGLDKYEVDLEMIALKHEYAYIQKYEVNKILPLLKALSIHLANQGIILNDNFERDLEYIQNFIRGKIQNKTIENIKTIGEFKKISAGLMKGTSILALAFNPKQLYQIIDGLWKDIKLIWQYDDEAFTFKNFKDSFFWIIQDVVKSNGELSLGEALNQLYGINDMDINQLPSRYAKDTYGSDRLQKAMFRLASRPDYYNRLTIFGAQMRGDGCFDAHSVVDGKLVYDWTKDKRFDLFAKVKGDESKVFPSEIAKFKEQKALYYTMAKEMVNDGTVNSDGNKFILNMNNPMPLPKAYTVRQSESMKALGDKTYGYYASEKKSLIQSFTLGAMIFQMNTFWSSKKNQYFSGRGYTQDGEWVDYVEENPDGTRTPYYLKYNEETGEMDITDEVTGVPVKIWKGRPQEGAWISLMHLAYDLITGRRDEEGQSILDIYWNNKDPYLRRMYRANWRQWWYDILGMLIIGWLVGPSLVNAANDYAKSIGGDTIDTAGIGLMVTLGANMLDQSADDFNFLNSVFGRGVQWTPFSLQSGWRLTKGLVKAVSGDIDWFDTFVNQTAFARNSKPFWNYVKLNSFNTPVGKNMYDED